MGSGDGELDVTEFEETMEEPDVKSWMASMGLEVKDARAVFTLVDSNGDGRLSAAELVDGVGRLMGNARNLDLLILMNEQQEMIKLFESLVDTHRNEHRGPLAHSISSNGSGKSQAKRKNLSEIRLAGLGRKVLQ